MKNILIVLLFMLSVNCFSYEKTEIVVDRNGTGDFRNIQDAIDLLRTDDPRGQITIYVKNGYYKEKIILPAYITNVRIVGEDREKTIINYDDHANINKMGTFRTYTFLLSGNDVILENLTIENSAAQLGQAVALHIEGDRIIVRNCRLLGNQDTIFAGRDGSRQYFENCYIEGTTDFIFGPSTVWFEKCTIHCKRNSYITAANTPQNVKYGFIFNRCNITTANDVDAMYLGRPWRDYAMTLFMNCTLPVTIKPEGWHNWNRPECEKTVRYMEYNNNGDGAKVAERVKWAEVISAEKAKQYTIEQVLAGCDNWNPVNR
ncbi:MAG: pectinesterase family protein [Dysgonomonas sp.]|uniref:pectinesterase family protein n=1 Tax=Dysgonomonas sp. TaxID=1891233 RepID=UPI0039E34C03